MVTPFVTHDETLAAMTPVETLPISDAPSQHPPITRSPIESPEKINQVIARPSVTPSPSPTPHETKKKPEEELPLNIIIQKNELCLYSKLNPDLLHLTRALLNTGGAILDPLSDQILNELFGATGVFAGGINAHVLDESKVARFYEALLASNQLSALKLDQPHYQFADSLLTDLEQEDPKNAAFPFFHAIVLQQMKANYHDVRMAMERAVNGTEFDIFLDTIQTRLYERGMINPTAWLAAKTISSKIPSPRFDAPQWLEIGYLSQDQGYLNASFAFGKLLMKKHAEDQERKRQYHPHFLENATGLAILKETVKWINPALLPPNSIPNSRPENDVKADHAYGEALEKLKEKDSCRTYLVDRVFLEWKGNFHH